MNNLNDGIINGGTRITPYFTQRKNYLDVNSTWRDRNKWPSPGEFEMVIAQSGRKDKGNAIDPVCRSTPITSWTANAFEATARTATVSLNLLTTGIGATSDTVTFICSAVGGQSLQIIDNYYAGAVIINPVTGDRRRINYYYFLGSNRGEFVVANAFPDGTFTATTTFTISDPTNFTDPLYPFIFVPAGVDDNNYYSSFYLYNESRNDYRQIINYDRVFRAVIINTTQPIVGWLTTDNFSIRNDLPENIFTTTSGSTRSNIIISNSFLGSPDSFPYDFIRIRGNFYGRDQLANSGLARQIISWSPTTQSITVFPPFPVAVGTAPNLTNLLELLPFSYDNVNPFIFIGNQELSQQMIYYELELLSICLPNVILQGANGSFVTSYPYVYVRMTNGVGNSGTGSKTSFLSNNPNAIDMTFKATYYPYSNLGTEKFVKYVGDGMVQTIQFRPSDTLLFAVKLPDGTVFNPLIQDATSPAEPLDILQVSAQFSYKKVLLPQNEAYVNQQTLKSYKTL